jgi:hypothetical protein
MSTKDKSVSLRWLIVVVVTIAISLVAWLHYRDASSDPRDRRYTTQQWLEMFTRREHQPIATWKGIGVGHIRKNSIGHSYDGLVFRDTPARVLEHQFSDLLEQEPLAFLPLFDSTDPEVILTGVYIYRRSPAFMEHLSTEDKSQVAAAFRKLLSHDDVRMRFTAGQTLGERRWLTVDDVDRGFDDEALSLRVLTAWWAGDVAERPAIYSPQGKLLDADPNQTERVDIKRKLAPVLLDHLNDPHFIIRSEVYGSFHSLLAEGVAIGQRSGHDLEPTFPTKIDWVRGDWHTREQTRKAWKAWWAEHGEEALRWTHPSN